MSARQDGHVVAISGPVVTATALPDVRILDVVRVGTAGLLGEVIKIDGDRATVQVFEETAGLRAGEPVVSTGEPLHAELGPGLLGAILDGTGRPLTGLRTGGSPYTSLGVRTRRGWTPTASGTSPRP